MSNKTLRVGLVGTGFMGRVHANCWTALPGADLVAIADPTPASREKCPGSPEMFEDWGTMLEKADVDLVDVATPTPWHAPATIAGLQAGHDVLCEKPMALTLEDCNRMLAAEKASGRTLMIAHVIRFWPEYAYLMKVTQAGLYGKLRSFTCLRRMAVPMYNWDMWTHDEARAGGVPFEGHIHDVDYVRYLMGDPKAVFAIGTRDETGINQVWASYIFDDERRAMAEGSWGYQPTYPFQHGYVADFDDAVLDYNLAREDPLVLYRPEGDPEPIQLNVDEVTSADSGGNISDLGGYYREIEYYADCLKHGRKPTVTTAADARESVRLLLAEIESINTGQIVTL